MLYLVDTNVLLRFSQRTDMLNPLVRSVIEQLNKEKQSLFTTVQNCKEFWNVATRPTKYNGFGITNIEADKALNQVENIFTVIPGSQAIYKTWRSLVINHNVSGVQVHDAYLVAVMMVHGVERILTFNDQDFKRFEPAGIKVIHPQSILTGE